MGSGCWGKTLVLSKGGKVFLEKGGFCEQLKRPPAMAEGEMKSLEPSRKFRP